MGESFTCGRPADTGKTVCCYSQTLLPRRHYRLAGPKLQSIRTMAARVSLGKASYQSQALTARPLSWGYRQLALES